MLDYRRGVLFCRGDALHDDEMSLLFMLIVWMSDSVRIIFLIRFFTAFSFFFFLTLLDVLIQRLSTPTLMARFYIVE